MINNDNADSDNKNIDKPTETTPNKPDERAGTVVQGFLKIFDPETGEIIVQGRD